MTADFWNPFFTLLGAIVAAIVALVPSYLAYSLAMLKLKEVADNQTTDRKIITETRDWVDGLKLEVLEKQWAMAQELAEFKDTPVSRDIAARAKEAYEEHLRQRDRNVAKDVQIAVETAVKIEEAKPEEPAKDQGTNSEGL